MARIRQAVSFWCFNREDLPFVRLCQEVKRIGYEGLEMVPEDHWQVAKHFGVPIVTHTGHEGIQYGLNRPANHARIQAELAANIAKAAENSIASLICFSGNRAGIADEEGLNNTVAGLKLVAGLAEQKGVTLLLELLNSRVDHKDYQCDRTWWGAEVVKRVGSPRVKLLYDIYHMQIMEGDLIRSITGYMPYLGHFHIAGNPGRHDPDGNQEIHYPAIMRAIAASPFEGFVGQEFVPKGDPVAALESAFHACKVD